MRSLLYLSGRTPSPLPAEPEHIDLSGEPYIVLGVIAPEFHTDPAADAWLPFQIDPESTDGADYFSVAASLRPGVTLDRANAQLKLAGEEFRRKYRFVNPQYTFGVKPIQDEVVGEARNSLLVLAGAVSFVLLIACANVTNLLLARAAGRKREIAIRAAVGAERHHIVRQLMTESVLLFLAGGCAGLIVGMAGVRARLALNPGNIPRIGENGMAVTLDWRVFASPWEYR
jgi:putative ABC transport system permease protein